MPLGIEVLLLGPATLLVDGSPVPVPGARQRVALAAMALAPGGTVTTEALADHIWGEDPPARMRPALHTTVTRLRKLVGTQRVVSTPGGYSLDVPDDAVDVRRFRSLVSAARGEDDPAEEARLLVEARSLWRGEPLDGVDSERLRAEHVYPLIEEWFAATERLIDLRLAAGDHGDLAGEIRALISRHPLRESLWSRLMRALAASGRQSEALSAYQEIRRQLLEELGVDPGRELAEAHAAVLAGTPAPSLAPDDGGRPAPPPVPIPRQLPPDLSTFTGREDELAVLDRLASDWDNDPARRTTIAVIGGAGGMGKTALAVHWGHRAEKRFPDGQLYVNLRGFGPGTPVDPSAAAGAMLGALSVPDEQIPADPDARSALLRSSLADRRVLVVLDNARDVEQVRPLLPGSSAFVLVTSRRQLRGLVSSVGAHRITLSGLSDSESVRLLGGGPAAPEVAELCSSVPLALAVAAERLARSPDGRVDDMLEDLRQRRLDALSASDDERTDVRAVLSWSYRALQEDEARLFRLLPLAQGADITAAAAAVLAARTEPEARRMLDRLVDAHLLFEKSAGRFEQHDLIRAYAAELCSAEDEGARTEARRRVWTWYQHTAANARHQLGTHHRLPAANDDIGVRASEFDDRAAAVAWMHAEHEKLAELVTSAADAGEDRIAWLTAAALTTYFTTQRLWAHPTAVLERGLESARRANDRFGEALLLGALGDGHHFQGRFEESIELSRQALDAFRAIGDARGEVGMLANIGMTLTEAGRLDEAIAHHRQAVAACAWLGDPLTEALILGNLAAAYNQAGRPDAAIATAERGIELSREAEDPLHEANVLDELGTAYAAKGEHGVAVGYFREALDIYRAEGHPFEVHTLHHLARTQREAGHTGPAREAWRRAAARAAELDHPLATEIQAELAAL